MLPWKSSEAIAEYRSAIESSRPYFGPVCQADQGNDNFKYFPAVIQAAGNPTSLLEIGSWAGASLVAWDRASHRSLQLHAVDIWESYFTERNDLYDMMNHAADTGEIERLFRHNARVCGLDDHLTVIKKDSREALKDLHKAGKQFDVIYIDGCHLYHVVRDDIQWAKLLVKDGGILCGDDLEEQIEGHGSIAHRALISANVEAGHADGKSYHVGVSQAVADHFGPVSCYEGFWLVRKVHGGWEHVDLTKWE